MPSYLTSLYTSSVNLFSSPSSSSSSSITTLPSIDTTTLLDYFDAQAPVSSSQTQSSSTNASNSSSSKNTQTPPWSEPQPSKQAQNAAVLSTTNFIPQTTPQLVGATASDTATQKDNQNLFTLYQAVNSLSQLAAIAQKSGNTPGQLQGYDTRFQAGLSQVESYLSSTTFNNFTLQTQTPSATVTSGVSIPFAAFNYTGQTLVSDANLSSALPNISTSQSFNIAITKGGTTTNVPIDLSQVQGPLTLDNIISYVNQQLSSDGFKTRLSRDMTSGSISDTTKATYGIQITQGVGETMTLSSSQATPSLYLAGASGNSNASRAMRTPASRAAKCGDTGGSKR